jgi:hypothetical protein
MVTYNHRLRDNLCPTCGAKRVDQFKMCARCREKAKLSRSINPEARRAICKRWRLKNKVAGLCACGLLRSKNKKSCLTCRMKRRDYSRLVRSRPGGMAKAIAWNRVGYRRLKEKLFQIYGPNCRCCKETRREFLTIDHIKPVGSKPSKFRCGVGLFRWLKKMGFPKGFRVLCLNCNFSIGHFGYCPHRNKATWKKSLEWKKA